MILFLIMLLTSLVFEAQASNITATGGGIVKPGTDLVRVYLIFLITKDLNFCNEEALKHDTFINNSKHAKQNLNENTVQEPRLKFYSSRVFHCKSTN